MSACISRAGEYGDHIPDDAYTCTRCGVLDEDALIAELRQARAHLSAAMRVVDAARALRDAAKSSTAPRTPLFESFLAAVDEFDQNTPASPPESTLTGDQASGDHPPTPASENADAATATTEGATAIEDEDAPDAQRGVQQADAHSWVDPQGNEICYDCGEKVWYLKEGWICTPKCSAYRASWPTDPEAVSDVD